MADDLVVVVREVRTVAIATPGPQGPPGAGDGCGGTGTEILPTFRIDTAGGAAVTTTITYVAASYSLSIPGEGIQTGTLRIRGRGNYTWGLPKKPYRLNFDVKTSPLGMSALQKDWALLANHDDPRKLGNILAWTLGAEMSGLTWTPQWREVELVLNGDFLGLYLLSDLVRMEAGRVPGSKAAGTSGETVTGAWLAEISRRYIGEAAPGFTTTTGVMIQYDTPEVDLASTDPVVAAQAVWFRDHIQAFEDALFLPDAQFGDPVTGYPPYIDTMSFADWYLLNELASNQDSNFDSSCKLWKERDSGGVLGKIHMGPLWDFGISFGNVVNYAHPTAGWYTLPGAVWIQRLVSDPAFKALLLARWQVLKALIPLALDTIDAEIQRQGPAIDRDVRRWNSSPVYTSEVASRVKAWLTARVAWLDGALPTIPGVGPAILPAPDVFSDTFSDNF